MDMSCGNFPNGVSLQSFFNAFFETAMSKVSCDLMYLFSKSIQICIIVAMLIVLPSVPDSSSLE
jgi:hypothetical protein